MAENQKVETSDQDQGMNMENIKKILTGWALTVPCGLLASYLLTMTVY